MAASYQEGFLGRKAAYCRGFFLLWQLELQVAELKPPLSRNLVKDHRGSNHFAGAIPQFGSA